MELHNLLPVKAAGCSEDCLTRWFRFLGLRTGHRHHATFGPSKDSWVAFYWSKSWCPSRKGLAALEESDCALSNWHTVCVCNCVSVERCQLFRRRGCDRPSTAPFICQQISKESFHLKCLLLYPVFSEHSGSNTQSGECVRYLFRSQFKFTMHVYTTVTASHAFVWMQRKVFGDFKNGIGKIWRRCYLFFFPKCLFCEGTFIFMRHMKLC